MRKRSSIEAINEIRRMLDDKANKSLTLENFIMPDESYNDEEDDVLMQDEEPLVDKTADNVSGIEKELTQIRKIALSVINRLADKPTSPQYDTMKKIWNMVDKAIEQPQKGNSNFAD